MTTNETDPPCLDQGPATTSDSVVAIETQGGVILYDQHQPQAWISSTTPRTLTDTQ